MQNPERDPSAPPLIVVAEDDESLAVVIQGKLARSGYRVHVERDGGGAWQAILQHAPRLVVLDWMMPELDGLAVLARIRADARTRHLPVIMLTAVAQMEEVRKALAAGANDYLVKPFRPDDLAGRVARLLNQPSAA
jgi:CheY-like chemotaxis protein